MDNERLEEIRERQAKAAGGPWAVGLDPDGEYIEVLGWLGGREKPEMPPDIMSGNWYSVASWDTAELAQADVRLDDVMPTLEFIAHAREDVPDLIAALEDAQQRIERLRGALAYHIEECARLQRQIDWDSMGEDL